LQVEGTEALQVPKLVTVDFMEAVVELVWEVAVGVGVPDMAACLDVIWLILRRCRRVQYVLGIIAAVVNEWKAGINEWLYRLQRKKHRRCRIIHSREHGGTRRYLASWDAKVNKLLKPSRL
jgi:hypothetical protein